MKWFLNPTGLSKNNTYSLYFTFENNENDRYWIHQVRLEFPELRISGFKEIK